METPLCFPSGCLKCRFAAWCETFCFAIGKPVRTGPLPDPLPSDPLRELLKMKGD